MNFCDTKLCLAGLTGLLLATFASAQSGETDSRLHADGPQGWGVREAKVKNPNLPRVLLIGDSILNGYLPTVVHELDGKANVDAWVNPYHQASEGLHEKLAGILAGKNYAVIHFNMGLHGWAKGRIPDGQFIPLTTKLVETIRTNAPKARLVWASSTPVTTKGQPIVLDLAINPIIVNHNAMAAQVMSAAKVPINDLYSLMVNRLDLARGDQFHWKPEGSLVQGKAVAASIAEQLKDLVAAADTQPLSQVIRLRPGSDVSHEIAAPEGRFRNIDVPTLTAFLPDKNASAEFKGTAVIVCPGGGYSVCDFEHHGIRLANQLNRAGIAVFVLKYRLSPPSKNVKADALADAERAVRIVRSRADEFGVNPKRIGLAGYSAGANLSIHVSAEFDAGKPSASDPVERASSRPDFIALLCPWAGTGETRCPYQLRADSPPTFICHSKDDKVAPVSVAQDTTDTLQRLKVPVELHLFDTGGHGNFNLGGQTPGGQWPTLFLDWLRKIMRDKQNSLP